MDINKFLNLLPQLYQNWEQSSQSPQNDYFLQLKEQLNSKISLQTMQLLNASVSCLQLGEVYCQVGCSSEAALIAALLDNPEAVAYAIEAENTDNLEASLPQFNLAEQVCICNQDLSIFFQELEELNLEDKIGVYYYNDSSNYRDVLKALMSVKPFLSEQAFIILANLNVPDVEEAINDFMAWHPDRQLHQLLNTKMSQNVNLDFDQGLAILLWQSHPEKLQNQKITAQGLAKLKDLKNQGKNILLHVGCGPWRPNALPDIFDPEPWVELRLDIDPQVKPDIIGSITDLSSIEDNCVDAIYSSHNLEHIYDCEIPGALAEFKRVLKPGGFVLLVVPDLQIAAEFIAKGDLESPAVYTSPAGDIPPLLMFYGMRTFRSDMSPYMDHKTGFTAKTMQDKLNKAGFANVQVFRKDFNVIGYGQK